MAASRRSFCYVDDLMEGLMLLMQSPDEVTGPIKLGNQVEFTMADLARQVVEFTESKSELVHAELPPNDSRKRKPDITKAQKVARLAASNSTGRRFAQHDRLFPDPVGAADPF
jgi:nucleoside-diphosphate-sugar epimerase